MAPPVEKEHSRRMNAFRRLFTDFTRGPKKFTTDGGHSPVATARSAESVTSVRRVERVIAPVATPPAAPLSDSFSSSRKRGPKKNADDVKIVEAKELAKEDDEEFENEGAAGVVAKCSFNKRELQWKSESSTSKSKSGAATTEMTADDGEKTKTAKRTARRRTISTDKSPTVSPVATPPMPSPAKDKKAEDAVSKTVKVVTKSVEKSPNKAPAKVEKKEDKKKADPVVKGREKKSSQSEEKKSEKTEKEKKKAVVKVEDEDDVKTSRGHDDETVDDRSTRPTTKTTREAGADKSQLTTDPDAGVSEIDQNSKDFKLAIELMEMFKRNNILENALFPAQNETLRVFFEGGMHNPDNKILGLISKAMDSVMDAVFFRGEDLDCMIDNEMKKFINDRTRSKPILLDVILSRPEFLPQSWGGRTVVLRAKEAEVNVNPEAKKP